MLVHSFACTNIVLWAFLFLYSYNLTISSMSKSIDIKIKSKRLRVTVSHTYKLSNGGYFHIAPIVLSFGSNGFGISLIGIYVGFSINNLI